MGVSTNLILTGNVRVYWPETHAYAYGDAICSLACQCTWVLTLLGAYKYVHNKFLHIYPGMS